MSSLTEFYAKQVSKDKDHGGILETPRYSRENTGHLNMQHSCWHLWCSITCKNPPQSTISKNNGMPDSLFFTQSSMIGQLWVHGNSLTYLVPETNWITDKQNKRDTIAFVSVSKVCSFVASMSCHGDSTGTAVDVVGVQVTNFSPCFQILRS